MSLEASWMLYNCDEALFLWTIKDAGALSLLRSIPDHYRRVCPVNHTHIAAGWWPPVSSRCPATSLRGNLKVGIVPNAMVNLLLTVKALEGRNRGLATLPSGPTPFSSSAASLTYQAFYLSPQNKAANKAAWLSVELCGYANVSRLVAVLVNGWAEEVNKRVWMRGGGQRVKEIK